MSYARHLSANSQSEKVWNKKQVKNNAGGYVFQVSPLDQVRRFLILGSAGGTYYASERKLTIENANVVLKAASSNVHEVVNLITDVCTQDLAPKRTPAIFATAILLTNGYTADALSLIKVCCRTSTDLFQLMDALRQLSSGNPFSGSNGALIKAAIADWYNSKPASSLAYQVTKYQQRDGWSHRDVLRQVHPKPADAEVNNVFKYVCQKDAWLKAKSIGEADEYLAAVEEAKSCDLKRLLELIDMYKLQHEHILNEYKSDVKVWEALLPSMKTIALLRNLGNLSKVGLLKPLSSASQYVCSQLDRAAVEKSRVHPYQFLLALKNYGAGRSWRGSGSWNVDTNVTACLDQAFQYAFKNVVPTGKRFYLGLDVSGSMTSPVLNSNISCREAVAALSLITAKTEPITYAKGFSTRLVDLQFNKCTSIADALKITSGLPFAGTDCSLPMIDAQKQKLEVDVFCVYTDNETWAGSIHPFQALRNYRQSSGIDAKLIVIGMASNGFTIADPSDRGMLDIVGFDASAPQIISNFAIGNI